MSPHKPSKDERDFAWVVKFSAAIGLGLMVAFLYSIKQIHPDLVLEFSFGTGLAFGLTAALAWGFCSVLFKGEFGDRAAAGVPAGRPRARRWVILFLVFFGLATPLAFLYSLKDVSTSSRREVIIGTGVAVVVLGLGGLLIHKSVRFFEEQDRASLQQQQEEKERDERGEE